ncbi:alpha/beta-hydrolase [Lindgomyces ingoldianus]|uniref:Alpha/beta-hydrolase n=1 Tax=Lindgomyces ingoldianus TaxID=673940 RepID=A0ACB6QWX0_9PLEO|nr:alpha/beta-hydrolase [Lindgomyces ingoldianus]KAF2470691.1 alpha/beta-hydrolase [Lindgomyces ingoldianus]
MASPIILLICLFVQSLLAVDLTVDVGYTKYRGTDRGNGIYRWAGMRYARSASRRDGMRFAPPAEPPSIGGIVDAKEFGPVCISSGTDLKSEFGVDQSEDCLFVNVFAPAKATATSNLPVYVFIQGGGFNANGNPNFDGASLIHAANFEMVVVNFNYRVGPYGFLAGQEIVSDKGSSLNNGLKDQRQLLKWVKTHIRQFGGDPDHVTLGGASAGGGSVVLHLTAYGGRDDKLFNAAVAESQAFPPLRTVKDSQFQYDELLKQTGCKDLKCMRDMDAVQFQKAVRSINMPFPGGKEAPMWFWNPTLDYDFIGNYTYNEIKAGHLVKVPTIFGDDTNEGTQFIPDEVTSMSKAEQFVSDQYTTLSEQQKASIRAVFQGPTNTENDPNWKKVAAEVFGSIRYVCPGINISAAYANNGSPTWQYRWDVGSALHVSELGPVWFNGTSAAAVFIHNYFASFIRSYDPNKYKHDFFVDGGKKITSPTWEQFGKGNGKRMLFADNNLVKMEDIPNEQHQKCGVISGLGISLKQ